MKSLPKQKKERKKLPNNLSEQALNFLSRLKREKKILDFAVKKPAATENCCIRPFTTIEIDHAGNVYTCAPTFIKFNKIGNIKENTLAEIWNGEKAKKLRKRILYNDESLCDLDICRHRININPSMLKETCPMPKFINLSYDTGCNIKCITCRINKYKNPKDVTKFYDEKVYNALAPLLGNAEIVELSGGGEAFYSAHSRTLIKKIAAEYKNIRFNILTNGILFNAKNCKALGIYGRINTLLISLPAMNEEIYNKIISGGNLNIVLKNIKDAAYECNSNKTLRNVLIHAVISILNYQEIPALAEFARENNINLVISKFDKWETAPLSKNYEAAAVWDKKHPEFQNFKQILRHPALNYEKITMTPLFAKIKKEITH